MLELSETAEVFWELPGRGGKTLKGGSLTEGIGTEGPWPTGKMINLSPSEEKKDSSFFLRVF